MESKRLDLGCGIPERVAPGHIGIDIVPTAEIVWDLNLGLPMKEISQKTVTSQGVAFEKYTDFIEGIRCHQVIEHLRTIIPMMNDCYQVLKPGCLFELSTPVAGTKEFWQDPTHIKGYVPDSFQYFALDSVFPDAQEEYGITARFKIVEIFIEREWNMQIRLTK